MMTPAQRANWLEWRSRGLGASDVGTVLGLTSWGSPTALWRAKRHELGLGDGPAPEPMEVSDRMSWGRHSESALADFAAERYGWTLDECEPAVHPEHDWARATPDRCILDAEGWPETLVELKVVHERAPWGPSGPADDENVPPYIVVQVQWQLFCTGLRKGWIVAMVAGDLRRYEVTRDDALLAAVFRKCSAFWSCVLSGELPEDSTDRASAEYQRMWPLAEALEGPMPLLDTPEAVLAEFEDVKAQIKSLEGRSTELRNRLLADLKTRTKARAGKFVATTYDVAGRSYLAKDELLAAYPDMTCFLREGKPVRHLRVRLLKEGEEPNQGNGTETTTETEE